MATLRSREIDAGPQLRRELAAHDRELAETFGYDGEFPEPWTRRADALDRGEAVEVSGWEISRLGAGTGPYGRWRIEPDGSVVRVPYNSPEVEL